MSDLVRLLSLAAAFFAVAGLLIALGVFRGCARSDSESAIAEEIRDIAPVFNMSANQLVRTYLAAEESAAAAYNGQVGIIRGPSLRFREASNHFQLSGTDVWTVRCFVSNMEADKVRDQWDSLQSTSVIRRVSRGVSVSGSSRILVMKGRVEGINNKHLAIDLHGCTLQDSP